MNEVLSQDQEIVIAAEESVEAILVHGSPIKYGLPILGKSDLFRTMETAIFLKQLRKTKKELLPVLDLWCAKYKIVVADFDILPVPFQNWLDFRMYLSFYYGHMGLVLESPSGKAKIIFVVEIPGDQPMNLSIAKDTLDWLLREEEREVIDRGGSANCRLFINEKMYQEIRKKIDLLPIYAGILDSVEDNPQESKITHAWNFLRRDANELGRLDSILTNETQWFLIRFILGSAKMALDDIDLPQPYILEQAALELKPDEIPALPTLSRARKSLVKLGLLVMTDDRSGPGWKGRTFRAIGILKEVCEDILANLKPRMSHVPPTYINDGDWNEVLLREVNYFVNRDAWDEWFYSLPGCKEKDREKKMKNMWIYHLKSKVA